MTIGFIGLGTMGSGMASPLIDQGHDVAVYDLNTSAVRELEAQGATATGSVEEASHGSDTVILCVPGPAEVERVLLGDAGVLAAVEADTVVIDHSTISRRCALDVATECGRNGVHFLNAPVTGRPPTSIVFAGGDAAVLESRAAIIGLYSSRIVHTGPAGTGSSMKLANQLLLYSNFVTLCEALVVGTRGEVAPETILRNLRGGDSMLEYTRQKILDRSFDEDDGAPMSIISKDMGLVSELASDLGLHSDLIERLDRLYAKGMANGWADQHFARVLDVVEAEMRGAE